MSKRGKKLDNQRQAAFDFEARLEAYQSARECVLEACRAPESEAVPVGTADEAAVEIAAAVKRSIRQTRLSREQVVNRINAYFGGEKLSVHMFNHYLSKPATYPLPSIYIFPLLSITGSLEILQALADSVGARVISGGEVRQMNLGKLEDLMAEMARLKKELKGGKS